MIRAKRVYDPPEKADGVRILVDRLWPRGLSKGVARVDLWLKEIAPSNRLRSWFAHDVGKWKVFREKYQQELKDKEDELGKIREQEKQNRTVTLVYAAKDTRHNNAIVLLEYLKQ